ncbi:MAG: HD domain-containing protein [Armatimonadota bacterium]
MIAPGDDRLDRQIAFLREVDRLKSVERRTRTIGGARRENSAEHSWHLALSVLVLAEHAESSRLDLGRALRMALLHDLVEIDAGDTFVYDASAMETKADRERVAAERIFGLLPPDQGNELRALWNEFEAGETPEARFASAVDRWCGVFQNVANAGGTWREHGIDADQVRARNRSISEGAPALWSRVDAWIETVCEKPASNA